MPSIRAIIKYEFLTELLERNLPVATTRAQLSETQKNFLINGLLSQLEMEWQAEVALISGYPAGEVEVLWLKPFRTTPNTLSLTLDVVGLPRGLDPFEQNNGQLVMWVQALNSGLGELLRNSDILPPLRYGIWSQPTSPHAKFVEIHHKDFYKQD